MVVVYYFEEALFQHINILSFKTEKYLWVIPTTQIIYVKVKKNSQMILKATACCNKAHEQAVWAEI